MAQSSGNGSGGWFSGSAQESLACPCCGSRLALKHGYFAGFSIYPHTKMGNERLTEIVRHYGAERIIANSACDWGVSDPLAVHKTAALMAGRGIAPEAIRKVIYDNALTVYGLSGVMKESDWTTPVPIDQRSLFQATVSCAAARRHASKRHAAP